MMYDICIHINTCHIKKRRYIRVYIYIYDISCGFVALYAQIHFTVAEFKSLRTASENDRKAVML